MSMQMFKDFMMDEDFEPEDPFGYLTVRRYEGAVVEVFEPGIHTGRVQHVDVSSMYPNIMIVFNLSPESVEFVKTKPYTGQYILDPTYIEVPDKTLNRQVCMKISQEDSISRKLLSSFYDRRVVVKASMTKEEKIRETGTKFAEQLTLKIFMNSIYGYNGMEWARYGSYLVAIATAAIGRFILTTALRWLREHGVKPLEMDTDGIYVEGEFDTEELNAYVQDTLFQRFPLRERLLFDTTNYEGMLVVRMKNYVLRYKGTNIWKGSGFHGSTIPYVAEHTVDAIADALFEGGDIQRTWYDRRDKLFDSELSEFEMVVRMSKSPDEYDKGSMYAKLFEQFPKTVEWGDEIRYAVIVGSRIPLGVLPDEELYSQLDYNYYYGRMKDIVLRLLEPMADTDEVVADFITNILKRKPARKCEVCGKRLNKTVRFLDTDLCWDCTGRR